jgi:hypothetical protein
VSATRTRSLATYTAAQNLWTVTNRGHRAVRTCPLRLYWEADYDPISDEHIDAADGAVEVFDAWRRAVAGRVDVESALPIFWSVTSTEGALFERAPLSYIKLPGDDPEFDGDFSTYYDRPVNVHTGEPVNWLRLPVIEKLWDPARGRYDKGGHITSATGWRPSALQPSVRLPLLVDAYGAQQGLAR